MVWEGRPQLDRASRCRSSDWGPSAPASAAVLVGASTSSTPEQVSTRHREITTLCDQLDALALVIIGIGPGWLPASTIP